MKAIIGHPSALAAKDHVPCEVVRGRDYGCRWHFHPEVELVLTLRGGTHPRIGDNISTLADGDLILIGSNLPHDFRNGSAGGIMTSRTQPAVAAPDGGCLFRHDGVFSNSHCGHRERDFPPGAKKMRRETQACGH